MKRFVRAAVLSAAVAATLLAGCGPKTATPTPSANVPVVSESPAIESPDISALVSPVVSAMPSTSPAPSADTSEDPGTSPAA